MSSSSASTTPPSIRTSLACGGRIPGSTCGNLRITSTPAASTFGRCRREDASEPAIFTLGARRTVAPCPENMLESPATSAGLLSTVGSGGGANKCAAEITELSEDAGEPPQRWSVDRTADCGSDVTHGVSRLQEVVSAGDATSEHAGSRRTPAATHPQTTSILCGKRSISIVRDKNTPRARHGSIHARLVVSAHRRCAGVPINQTNTNLPLAQCGVFTVVKALVSRTSQSTGMSSLASAHRSARPSRVAQVVNWPWEQGGHACSGSTGSGSSLPLRLMPAARYSASNLALACCTIASRVIPRNRDG